MEEDRSSLVPRKLTHEQARLEQRRPWSKWSIAERLSAMTALTERPYRMRGINLHEFQTDLHPCRVLRSRR